MDVADASGNRGWDVLWFGLTSFLQGYDDVRQNAYLWLHRLGLRQLAFYFDEYDPAHLNLGRGTLLANRTEVDAAAGHCCHMLASLTLAGRS